MSCDEEDQAEKQQICRSDEPPNLKLQILQKRLNKQAEDAAQCTFQPLLVSKTRESLTVSAIGGMSRFDRLYKDAQKRQEDGVARAAQKNNTNFSQVPNNRSRSNSVSSRSSSTSRGTKMSAESVNRLYNASGAGRQLKNEKTTAEIEAVMAMQNTFKPEITKRGSNINRKYLDTGDRMMRQFQDQIERKKKLEEHLEKQASKECTFSPVLNKPRPSSASKVRVGGGNGSGTASNTCTVTGAVGGGDDKLSASFKQRLQMYEQERQRRREQLRKAKEDAETAAMQRISISTVPAEIEAKVSEKIKSLGVASVFDRLAIRVEKDVSVHIDPKEAELTFKPQINAKAAVIYPTRSSEAAGVPIHERLFKEAQSKRNELEQERIAALEREAQTLSFKPKIPHRESADDAITGVVGEGGGGTNDSLTSASVTQSQHHVFERLSSSRQYMHNLLTQIKSDLEMSECTFKPKIPAESEAVMMRMNSKPIHERLNEEAAIKKEKEGKR